MSQTEREAIAARRSASGLDGCLRSDAEDAFDKKPLPNYVAFRQPADLTFANDVHGLVSRDRTQRAVHRAESLTGNYPLLHKAVILLNDVIPVLRSPAPAVPAEFAVSLQFADRGGVSRMTIHIDDSRPGLPTRAGESLWPPPDPGLATAGTRSYLPPNQRRDINRPICRPHARKFHRPARIVWVGASRAGCADSESGLSAEPSGRRLSDRH